MFCVKEAGKSQKAGTRCEINTHKEDLLMAIVKATTIYISYNKAPAPTLRMYNFNIMQRFRGALVCNKRRGKICDNSNYNQNSAHSYHLSIKP